MFFEEVNGGIVYRFAVELLEDALQGLLADVALELLTLGSCCRASKRFLGYNPVFLKPAVAFLPKVFLCSSHTRFKSLENCSLSSTL